jgi:hypothetical protein
VEHFTFGWVGEDRKERLECERERFVEMFHPK